MNILRAAHAIDSVKAKDVELKRTWSITWYINICRVGDGPQVNFYETVVQ